MFTRKSNRPRLSVQSLEGREVCTTLIELGSISHLGQGGAVQVSTIKAAPPASPPASAQP